MGIKSGSAAPCSTTAEAGEGSSKGDATGNSGGTATTGAADRATGEMASEEDELQKKKPDEEAFQQERRAETIFRDLDRQYTVARMSTHTHRGIGLGFGSLTTTALHPSASPIRIPSSNTTSAFSSAGVVPSAASAGTTRNKRSDQ